MTNLRSTPRTRVVQALIRPPLRHYRMDSVRFLMFGLLVCAVVSEARGSPADAIAPAIYARDDEAAAAMKSAPLILLVKVRTVKLTGEVRVVDKPPEIGGPMTPTIPLHLACIRAQVRLAVRGRIRSSVRFHSWVWASGKHGGPRLFHPSPGSSHAIFLRRDGRYLHTVGDYPSYARSLRASQPANCARHLTTARQSRGTTTSVTCRIWCGSRVRFSSPPNWTTSAALPRADLGALRRAA